MTRTGAAIIEAFQRQPAGTELDIHDVTALLPHVSLRTARRRLQCLTDAGLAVMVTPPDRIAVKLVLHPTELRMRDTLRRIGQTPLVDAYRWRLTELGHAV